MPQSGSAISVSEQEELITLIHAAREDRKFRRKVLKILRLEPFHRKSALGSYVSTMRLKGAPPPFVHAIELLREDRVSEIARALIEEVENGKNLGEILAAVGKESARCTIRSSSARL